MALALEQSTASRTSLRARAREWAVALAVTSLALGARAALPGEELTTAAMLLVAVVLSAGYGGVVVGVLSAAAAAGGLLLPWPPGFGEAARAGAFAACALLSAVTAGALRAAQRRAAVARDAADQRARALAASQSFVARLAAAREPTEVDRAVLEMGLPTLGAAGAILARARRGELEVVDVVGHPPDVMLLGTRIPVEARSPLAEAYRAREPVWIERQEEVQRRFPGFAAATAAVGRGALAAVPLHARGLCTGVIALSFPADRPFSIEDRTSILSLVTTVGRAFDRARLHDEVARERGRAELLASMAADLNRGTDLDAVIRTALVGAARLLRGDDGALFLFEGGERHLRGIAEVRAEERTGAVVDVERMPCTRRALEARRARFFDRASAAAGDAEWFDRLELTGSIVAPLLQGERRIGVLYVNYLGLGSPHPDELDFADAIAAQCALAISRAQAFETERRSSVQAEASRIEAEAAAQRVARLQEITAALSSAVTQREVAGVIIGCAVDQLGARAAGIVWRLEPDRLELLFGHQVSEAELRSLDDAARRGEPLPIADAIASRRAIWLDTAEAIQERYPVLEPLRAARGESGLAVVPLVIGAWCAGVIGLTFDGGRRTLPAEQRFFEAVAQVAAQAFERARLFESERTERARAAAAEEVAKQTARTQEQLMAVVGHDLRTPLSAIQMGAQLMARRGGLAPDQAETLSRVQHSAQRAGYIIHDLLDYSRRRRGLALSIQRRRIRVADVCETTVHEDRQVHRDVRISLRCDGDTTADADPARIAQVVSNLVGNAIQHGQGAAIDLGVTGAEEEVVIRVHNDGPPIPPALLPRIFEPFQRDARDSAGEHSGSAGLGLFIVREIVHAHGGRVDVSSGPEQGTTFTVCLPRTHRAPRGAGSALPARADAANG